MNLEVGKKAVYVEIKQNGSVKRFLLPDESNVMSHFKPWILQYETLMFIRSGAAEITTLGAPQEGAAPDFEGLTFATDLTCEARLHQHPDISNGNLRVSYRMIEAILATDVTSETAIGDQAYVQAVTTTGVDKLRQQLAGATMNVEPTSTAVAVADPPSTSRPGPVVPASFDIKGQEEDKIQKEETAKQDLRTQLAEAAKRTNHEEARTATGASGSTATAVPIGMDVSIQLLNLQVRKLMDILEEIRLLGEETSDKVDLFVATQGIPDAGVSGKVLRDWFGKTSSEQGWDSTFDILATKITGI
jgi:hypothetical protein